MDVTATYDAVAKDWSRKMRRLGYERSYAKFLCKVAVPVGAVLDVGTGSGSFACAWVAMDGSRNLTLLDQSAAMLTVASSALREKGVSPRIVHAAIERYTPGRAFRTILAAHVLEHCADPLATIQRLEAWLEPGGQLVVVASKPHWCNWLIWPRYRHRWFGQEQMVALALRANLRLEGTSSLVYGPPRRTSLGYIFRKS